MIRVIGCLGMVGVAAVGCMDTPARIGTAQQATTKRPNFTTPPTVAPNPNPQVPLAAVVTFSASEPVETILKISDGEHAWTLVYDASHDPSAGLPVVGMRPGRAHQIKVRIRSAGGKRAKAKPILQFTTPPLPTTPGEFPPLQTTVSRAGDMEPGITLMSIRRRASGGISQTFNRTFGMLLAVDAQGEVVWYYRAGSRINDFKVLHNGNIVYLSEDNRAVEIGVLGNVVASWYAAGRPQGAASATPVDAMTFHHKILELPSGNLAVLGTEREVIPDYYTSETDVDAPRQTQEVMGDQIVEFQRDGQVISRWSSFAHLDPFRIGHTAFSGFWAERGFPSVAVDWTHGNGLAYEPRDDTWILGMRGQSAIAKVDRTSGEIRWILGDPSGFSGELSAHLLRPEGDVSWFYLEHGPVVTPSGSLLVFDNGLFGAVPFGATMPPSAVHSRVVEYMIDEYAMSVRQVWDSAEGGPDSVLSYAMGDVDWLPTKGNVLATYGDLIQRDVLSNIGWEDITPNLPGWSRVREYTHTSPPELLWELVMDGAAVGSATNWMAYSSERRASLSKAEHLDDGGCGGSAGDDHEDHDD